MSTDRTEQPATLPAGLLEYPESRPAVLKALVEDGPSTSAELEEATEFSRGTVHRALDDLGELGLVESRHRVPQTHGGGKRWLLTDEAKGARQTMPVMETHTGPGGD